MTKDTKQMTSNERKLVTFVMHHVDKWRDSRDTNYGKAWDEYERLWLGVWSAEDRQRDSERSKVITPALQQAVESWQSEIEEATFGKGGFFDIQNEVPQGDDEPKDITHLRKTLKEDIEKNGFKTAISETLLNMGIYGTGIIELLVSKEKGRRPKTMVLPNSGMKQVGIEEYEYFCVKPNSVHPRSFVIDPAHKDTKPGLGMAVDEMTAAYSVVQDMAKGIYTKRDIGWAAQTDEIEPQKTEFHNDKDTVRVVRYYGLVPRELLQSKDTDYVELFPSDETNIIELYEDLVEAVVVIANEDTLLKAEETPYMMADRPIVIGKADLRPGKVWGRGQAEKGYNMQKTLDSQVRAHLDSLALTSAPMMGIDATRMPRGFKFTVSPGKTILTNGDSREILNPFKFGETSQMNVETANLFERYLLQATGTVDSAGMPDMATNGADADSMNAALSSIIKRHRRTMTHFQENFIIPLVTKTAWRYMQFDPERYPVNDYKFIASGTLGIIAREYEQRQYLGMMSTLGPESPLVPLLLRGILENSSLSNRDEMIAQLEQMNQPDPEADEMKQIQKQLAMLEMQEKQMTVAKLQAEANYTNVKAELEPRKIETTMIAALTKNSEEADEFSQRMKIAELALKEADINEKALDRVSNERISMAQMQTKTKTD
jgi:hypothetical protein